MNPTLRLCADYEAVSRAAANCVLQALAANPDLLLCAAGGSTPLRTYDLLAEAQPPMLFDKLRVLKLDEWGGLASNQPGTCEEQLQSRLMGPLKIGTDRRIGFNSQSTDPQSECDRVRRRLADEGPIDVCILGLSLLFPAHVSHPLRYS